MKQIFLSLAAVFLTLGVMAQSARVQVIHNSPTPGTDSGPTVDIYVNGDLLEELTAVPFRAATPFLDVPAGVDITVAVAVNPSNDVNDAIATFDLGQLDDGGTYVVMAHGIVGNATTPFNLAVNADARETSAIDGNVDFSVFHGSTDAPPVDVEARGAGLLVSGLDYPSFTDEYYSVPATNYTLDIRASGQTEIVASFVADLSGLANGVATVFASGLLNGTPSFGLFAALTDGTVVAFPAEAALPTLVINEIDYDQPGADNAEFIEILNVGDETVSLNGVEIALFNGGTNEIYSTTKLNDVELKSGEYYVVCYGNNTAEYCNQTVASGVQNGAPDGVQLLFNGEVIDAISYEGTLAGVAEGTGTSAADSNTEADVSLSRSPNGVDTDNNDNDFILACFSPGAENNTSLSCTAVTDSAMVQIIHNSPTPTVDIYANGDILLDDFEFRDATPFVSVPAGVEIDIAVAGASSSSAADAIANFPVTFTANETYIVVATGIVGNAETPFELAVYDMGRKQGNSPTDVDILVYHGATDAPAVDVRINGPGAVIVDDLGYKQFEDYQSVPAAEYFLDITPGDDNTMLVGTYRADVTSLGGSALTVFASGLLAGDPDFGLWVADVDGNTFGLERVYLDTANVQIIHNSPTTTVDIYANGELLEQDFEYGSATPYLRLPAGMEFEIAVAAAPSTSAADAVATFNVTFEANRSYAVVANGVPGDMDDPFNLEVNDQARTSANFNDEIDVLVFHGSAGAPAVDVDAKDIANLITNLSYTEFSRLCVRDSGAYTLEIKPTGMDDVVASFEADLAALAGQSVTVIARGDLAGGDIPFGLLAVLADGTTLLLPETPTANVQVIHNSPSPTVDVYANGALLLDDFAFRTAEPFQKLPVGVEIEIAIAPDTSTSAASAIYRDTVMFEDGKEYTIIAGGAVGNTLRPFRLFASDMARSQAADPSKVDFNIFHGSPDAPGIDVDVRGLGNLVSNFEYGDLTEYFSVDPGVYYVDVRPAGSPDILATLALDVSELGGQSVTIMASGYFLTTPQLAILAVLADGTVVPLQAAAVANVQVIHNSPSPTVDVYANGALLIDDFAFRTAEAFQFLPAGVEIEIAIAPDTSTSAASAIYRDTVMFENGKEYTVIAGGAVGNTLRPFRLFASDMARSQAADPSKVDFNIFHGSPDAPGIDVDVRGLGNLVSNFEYGDLTEYFSVDPGVYYVDVRPAGSPDILATLALDVSELGGQSVTIMASGYFLTTPQLAILAVLADGTVVPLQAAAVANVQVIHNSPSPTVDVYANGALLIDDFAFRTAEAFQFLPAGVEIEIAIAPDTSTSAASAIYRDTVMFENGKEYTVIAGGVVGNTLRPFQLFVSDMARSQAADPSQVDFNIFHGSPDAPGIDVDVRGLGNLVSNFEFGDLTEYFSVDPDVYYVDVRPAGSPDVLATLALDVSELEGQSATIMASGYFLTTPPLAILAVLADGTVVPLQAAAVANVQVIHNAIGADTVDIYAGEDLLIDDFVFRTATPFEFLPAGVDITLGIAPGNSTSVADTIATFKVNLEDGSTYVVIAKGILGDEATPFGLAINDMGQTEAASGSGVDLLLYHGSPDAPEVDVLTGGSVIYDNVAYDGFSNGYLPVPAAQYILDITPSDDNNQVVASYTANINGLDGGAAVIFASGLFSGGEPAFAIWVALPDGMTFPLPLATSTNDLDRIVQEFTMAPNPAYDQTTLTFGLTESTDLNLAVFGLNGQMFKTLDLGTIPKGQHTQIVELNELPSGQYVVSLISPKGILTKKLIVLD
jgi:hypothetical protein